MTWILRRLDDADTSGAIVEQYAISSTDGELTHLNTIKYPIEFHVTTLLSDFVACRRSAQMRTCQNADIRDQDVMTTWDAEESSRLIAPFPSELNNSGIGVEDIVQSTIEIVTWRAESWRPSKHCQKQWTSIDKNMNQLMMSLVDCTILTL